MQVCSKAVVDAATLNDYFHSSDTFATRLGIQIVEASQDHAVATMPLEAIHRNGMLNAHGGAIFSLADMTFAAAAHATGIFFVSAQASISYLEPGRVGPLRGVAKKIRCGKTLGIYEVNIYDADDTHVAVATITGYSTQIPIEELQKYRNK